MNQTNLTLRLASAALLAAAAFPFTPALAQDATAASAPLPAAAPEAIAPAAPSAPAPVMQSSPVVQAIPEQSAPQPAPAPAPEASAAAAPVHRAAARADRSDRTAVKPERASPVAVAAPVEVAPAAPASPAAAIQAPPPVVPSAAPAPIAPLAPAVDQPSNRTRELELGALAGMLVLGGLAVVATRRRSGRIRPLEIDEAPLATREPPAAPAPAQPFMFAPASTLAQPRVVYAPPAPPATSSVADGETAGELMQLRVPDSVEGRRALIERITAADPDEANPFRSPKARMRRARLIVQGMAQRQEQEGSLRAPDTTQAKPVVAPMPEMVDA